MLAPRRARRQIGEGKAGLAEDADEQIVEVVRHAAGQHAEAFEALRLLDSIVERPPLTFGPFPLLHLVPQGGRAFLDEALQVLLVPPQVPDPQPHEADDDQGHRREGEPQEPSGLVEAGRHLEAERARRPWWRSSMGPRADLEVVTTR